MNIIDDGLDPIGLCLGFGELAYHRFHTDNGIGGLAKWKWGGKELDILAVHSDNPGQGQFRRFIQWAQARFTTIRVWHISEPWLMQALARYGFSAETDISGDGEVMEGMRWDRIDTSS
jgi:hypothetical protein